MVVSSRLLPRCLVPVSGTFKRLEAGRLRAQSFCEQDRDSQICRLISIACCVLNLIHRMSRGGLGVHVVWFTMSPSTGPQEQSVYHDENHRQAPTPMRSWRVEARTFVSSSMHARGAESHAKPNCDRAHLQQSSSLVKINILSTCPPRNVRACHKQHHQQPPTSTRRPRPRRNRLARPTMIFSTTHGLTRKPLASLKPS